ncbi:TPR-like protein [Macroventuria anomochaeta]|uniref:TPR-like protein n=1 Tax=Macroventuria anomochaeta TaxID=301207 RepID=A0ACB6S7E8_9PLEO|nr:TPR-like protein [Macroventuria anomochaeta]KAF2629139.1 TPR-like protein [Macroventuria anomochaeta]
MLERASTCLESGGRQLFRAPNPCLRSRRKLHSTFWHHGASHLSLPLWWAINPTPNGDADQPATSAADAAPLDFLYPEKTLALLRRLSVRTDAASDARRQQLHRPTIRGYATARRTDHRLGSAALEAGGDALNAVDAVDAAEAKEAKREMHERLMASSAHESLGELLRRKEPGKQELAWQLYHALPAQGSSGTTPDLLLPLLEYLSADNEPAVPTRIIRLFDQLPDAARTASSYRAVIVAHVALREIGPAVSLHRTAAKGGRFVENEHHVPDIGTGVLLRRLVADEQWELALRVYSTYVADHRFSIDRQRTTYRIRWGQATLPEIWTEAAHLPEIQEHVRSLLVYSRQHKDELMSTPKKKMIFYTFVQSFLPHVMDRLLHVRKPNEDEIWDWFTKLFEDLHAQNIPVDASYNYAITAMLRLDRYRKYTNQRKIHLELYRRYRQWYLYDRVDDPDFKTWPPQLPMLSLVLSNHGTHGSLHRVHDMVHDIRTFYPNKPLPPNILGALLLIFAEHGDVQRVNEYFDEFSASQGKVDPKQANSLLYVQARRGDVPGALAVFRRIREDLGFTPDVQMWNTLLLTYVRADDLDGALETFNNALDAGMEPNEHTFGPMLDMCANRGDIEAFEALYSRAKQMQIALDNDVRARSGYVQAFLNAEDADGAEEIAQGMLKQWKAGALTGHPLTHTWNIMIQYYALRGDVANSRRLYREMVDNKIPLDSITFASLMRSLIEIKQTNAAYKILRVTLPANRMRVEAIHYAIVMTGFLKEGQYDLALETYERMVERNVSQTISSRQASINTVGMAELVRLLKVKNRKPRQHLQHVERLLRDMLTEGDVGQDVAHRQPNHNRYIDAHTQSIVPASYYGLLITLYNTRGAYKICKELFAKAEATMKPSDFDAPTTFLTAVMEAHYRAKEWDEVQKCWDLIRESSSKLIKTFQQVMNPAPEPPESPSLTDGVVIQRFEESRIALNRRQVIVKATRIYIRSLINRNPKKNPTNKLLQQAQLTIRDLLVNGFVIDNFTWNEFIVALAQNNQLVSAFTIAETYLMPRFPGWRNLAPFYVRHDRKGYQWMELRHYDVKRNSVLPRYKTLVVLAKALADVKEDERNGVGYVEREVKWAREILEEKAPSVCRAVETMPRTHDEMQERYFGNQRGVRY